MEERELTLPDYAGKRIDVALSEYLQISRNQIHRLIEEGRVQVEGKRISKNYRLTGNEIVKVSPRNEINQGLIPQDIPVKILFQDGDLLIVSKPAGLVVHPAAGHPRGTLINALLYRVPELKNITGEGRPGIVHRLDRDTSGLMVVARNERSFSLLQQMVKERRLKRWYLALIHGTPPTSEGLIDAPIGRDARDRKKMAVTEKGRPAMTAFKVKELLGDYSLVEVELITGRTHQIRVHFAYIGFPVAGDLVYGRWTDKDRALGIERQFLHAYRLSFPHPLTGETLSFEEPLPEDLASALLSLRRGKR